MTRDVWTIDTATARRLVAGFGGDTLAAADALTDATPEERARLIDAADEPLQARRQLEDFAAVAASRGNVERDEAGAAFLTCSHEDCPEYPRDERGNPMVLNVRKWWCDRHADQAAPGDSEQWTPPLALDQHGGLVDLEEQALERQHAEHLERQSQARAAVRRAQAEVDAKELPDQSHWAPSGPGWS